MDPNRRFSILPFPQRYEDGTLLLNIVVLPRNQNPLVPAIEASATIPDSPAFADAQLAFSAHLAGSLAAFPFNEDADKVERNYPQIAQIQQRRDAKIPPRRSCPAYS